MGSIVNPPRDPNTLSNYNNFLTTHTEVNFNIDFEKKNISGSVVLTLKSITDAAAKEILLDTSFLNVKDVIVDGKSPNWELLPRFEPYGSALKIVLEDGVRSEESVQLEMTTETTKDCTAIQWLTPAQTRSEHPYMFTQCQAIHTRSIFPCQDTPDVKGTFQFNIKSPLPVIASGLSTGVKGLGQSADDAIGTKLHTFEQKVPIPSYLFALASGDIAKAPIGPRSVVATGPKELRAAQWEFEESTERYIETVESIVFPYQWTEYNVLVLPPSFPYGGMENPVYTYATPTVISGDRANVDVIAHELSHSYSGNLVSNASWEHFWLNEGWTTYLERRLQAAVHGEAHRDFSAIIGWKSLQDSVTQFGDSHEFTKMVVDLKGKDPDDAFSSVPYEKGYTFLSFLEGQVTKDKWNRFIPHYFTTFARKSLDSYDFKANLLSFFDSDTTASKALKDVDWDSWFYAPGLPPKPHFDTSLVDVCYHLASKWETNKVQPKQEDINGWSANQVVVFLDTVLAFAKPLDQRASQMMGSTYGFAKSQNVEIVSRYYQVALKAKDETVYQPTAELLSNVGRMKFVRPLYRLLNEADRALAVETFGKNKDFYHPICRNLVEKDLFGAETRFYICAPMFQELPDFLAKIKYQHITDDTNTVHQVAHKSPLPAFLLFMGNPKAAGKFNEYMLHRRKDQAICWDVFPAEKETQGWSPDATVLVDIGGNIGHQCAEFKSKFPKVPGHVVLQDLPGPIEMALSTPGVENLIHDMFKPQPIKGAKFYYLRAVIRPDPKCREILDNIIQAMGPESVILLDEMSLPDTKVHRKSTQIDLTMMAALASRERTRTQWAELLGSVGLEIVAIHTYTPSIYESIMTVRRRVSEFEMASSAPSHGLVGRKIQG